MMGREGKNLKEKRENKKLILLILTIKRKAEVNENRQENKQWILE